MSHTDNIKSFELYHIWSESPEPTTKISNYFDIYFDLFNHLRGTKCTFIETGVLDGGSLFMWRKWLGNDARIIGIDLNPEALKWKNYGFDIYIGDQGDRNFWKETFLNIGEFDVLLDDGGHQPFQQIVTAEEAIIFAKNKCIIAIEDTASNFMKDFQNNPDYNFLNFAKSVTDNLVAKSSPTYPNRFIPLNNTVSIDQYKNLYKVDFFSGIVAFHVSPSASITPESIQNMNSKSATDFRYKGTETATLIWPDPRIKTQVNLTGGVLSCSTVPKSSPESFINKLLRSILSFFRFK